MKSKTRTFLIIITSLVLIAIGSIICFRYFNKPEIKEEVTPNNYYNSEFLFNNNYIKQADNITSAKDINKDLDIHTEGDTLYVNLLNQSSVINNFPEGSNVYYNHLDNDCYEFAALFKSDLYYSSICLNNKSENKFEKISSVAKAVYVPNIYKKGIYINDKNPISNFIIDTTIGDLKYISYKDRVLGLYNNIEKNHPYFDYVCASSNVSVCKHLMAYVTFEKELFFNDSIIKTNDNSSLIVQDLFSVLKLNSKDKMDISSISYDKFKRLDYLFRIYVLDKDNYLYTVDINSNNVNNSIKASKLIDKKVKLIDYKQDKSGKVVEVIITDVDGKITKVTSDDSEEINLSTIYERKSIINSLKK